MSDGNRVFRWLLRLFPADFRGDFGDDMALTFAEQRHHARQRGTMAALRLWTETVAGILTTAPREHWDVLRADVAYALTNLRRNPGFTAVATAALAIGIGANAAVFTIVDGVLLRALPYQKPDRLVAIFEKVPGAPVDKFDFSAPDFQIVRDAARSFSGMFAYRNSHFELSGISEPEQLTGTRVSHEFMDVLGVKPLLGRSFDAREDAQAAKVAILTYGLWNRVFGRDPNVLGRTIALDRQAYTVIGVMDQRFEFPPRGAETNGEPAALFVPISFTSFERRAFGSMYNNTVVARLNSGVTIAQARGDLAGVVTALAERYPPALQSMASQLTLPVNGLLDEVVGRSRRMLTLLLAAVAIVLLIGCADVANLMLTRATARQREIAVRAALGASGPRVLRQLLTEAFVLSAIGGGMGVILAYWIVDVLQTIAGTSLPRAEAITFDARVLVFTVGVTLLAPFLFGMAPAVRMVIGTTSDALKEGARGATPSRQQHRLLDAIVVAQFALALILSVGAGLLLRSFIRLTATDPGFRSEHVLTGSVRLPAGRYTTGPELKRFYADVVSSLRSTPGVLAAAASTDRPLAIQERRTFAADAAAQPMPALNRVIAATWTVGDYFDALGIRLKAGRYFTDSDGHGTEQVVIVSDSLARKLWPTENAIGHQIKWGLDANSPDPWMRVVGVVGDVNQDVLGTAPIPQTYEPIFQQPDTAPTLPFYRRVNILLRSNMAPAASLACLRAAVQGLDRALPVTDAEPLEEVVARSVAPQRFSMTVVAVFALIAVALAGLGIYGVLANLVSQQTHEIGVRVALGATPATVTWGVLRNALRLMVIGVGVGVPGAFAASHVMSGLLYEVHPTDAATFATAALVLAGLAVGVSVIPAWRATRVDPLLALRAE